MTTPRYLVPFHPKRVPHFFTDVLIIGGGLAGVRAAEIDDGLNVVIADHGFQSTGRGLSGPITALGDYGVEVGA